MCIRQISTIYTGDPLGLPPFIASIKLLQNMDTTNAHSDILKGVIMTKLQGVALECIPADPTIEQIIDNLKKYIKSDSSEVIQGKLMALKADRTNLTDFASKAESLAEQFKRALILENIPKENATKMTTKAIAQLCRANARSTVVDTLMAGENFETAKDAIAKYIIETRTESNKPPPNNIMAIRQTNRHHNNRNRFPRNGFNNNRYGNPNRNYDRYSEQNRNQSFGRQNNYRSNRGRNWQRGNDNRNNNWRGNSNRPRRQNVFFTENSTAPPSGAPRAREIVQMRQAEED